VEILWDVLKIPGCLKFSNPAPHGKIGIVADYVQETLLFDQLGGAETTIRQVLTWSSQPPAYFLVLYEKQ
jgi:hypothetical protein